MDALGNKIYFRIPPENDNGDVEYKWRLWELSVVRRNELATQMLWRVNQTVNNSVLYILGVHDNGTVTGIDINVMTITVIELMDCASTVNLRFCIRWIKRVSHDHFWGVIQVFRDKERITDHPIPDYVTKYQYFCVDKSLE